MTGSSCTGDELQNVANILGSSLEEAASNVCRLYNVTRLTPSGAVLAYLLERHNVLLSNTDTPILMEGTTRFLQQTSSPPASPSSSDLEYGLNSLMILVGAFGIFFMQVICLPAQRPLIVE